MKIFGILLILGALIGGGIILSDTIPGYFENKRLVVRAEQAAEKALAAVDKAKNEPVGADGGRHFDYLIQDAESAAQGIRYAHEGVERRRNETLMFGGGAIVVLGLGIFLFKKGSRRA